VKTDARRTGVLPVLKIPFLLLAIADLTALALQLRPWPEVANLPGGGTTAYDPAICLGVYVILILLMDNRQKDGPRQALGTGTLMGLLAGVLLIAEVLVVRPPASESGYVALGLLCGAGILCGVAGLRGAHGAGGGGVPIGILTGIWTAMTAALMGTAAVLAQIGLSQASPLSSDPWKQYEGLAIGTEAVQSLVHWLNTATAFLLIGPLVGGTMGLLFAVMALPHKD